MDKYPQYKKGELEAVFMKLPSKDKKVLENFLLSCQTSCNPHKIGDIKRNIVQFRHIIGKSFDSIQLKDLNKYLTLLHQSDREAWSKHDLKAHIKRFLKFHFKDWSIRFEDLKILKNEAVGMNTRKINSDTRLIQEEIEKVMNKESDLKVKTFFISLYESGMRPSELRTLKWKDIRFNVDGDLSEFNVFMHKNKKHKTTFVKSATPYLKKLQAETQGEYVFPSREIKDTPINNSTAHRWVSELGKHINKKIYPYLLRHSRAQELYGLVDEGKLAERVVQQFLGHSKSMRDVYSELDKKKMKEAVIKSVFTFEDLTPEKKHELEKQIDELRKQVQEIHEARKHWNDDLLKALEVDTQLMKVRLKTKALEVK